MSLVSSLPLLKKAQKEGKAIAAFNVYNLETVQGVIAGAAELKAPVMIATTPGTIRHAGAAEIAGIVENVADNYDIPVVLHLDHCTSYNIIVKAIQNGYTSVMIDGSELPYEENIALVQDVVKVAHPAEVPVEAELGRIGGTEDNITVDEKEATLTASEEAVDFVEKTNLDTLAVAIGTAHGVYQGEPKLDFKRLDDIEEKVEVPLVLHGASGVPDESVKKAVRYGICKVNIATELKIPFSEAVHDYFENNPGGFNIRKFLGAGRDAIKEVVKHKIKLCGSNGLTDKI